MIENEIERIIRVCMQRQSFDTNMTVRDRYKIAEKARKAIMQTITTGQASDFLV